MNALPINITPQQLRRAADLKERIDALQNELDRLLGSPMQTGDGAALQKKRRISAAGRAAIAAAARARCARIRGRTATAAPKTKKTMSAAARARIAASQRARWARIRGTTPSAVAAPKPKITRSPAVRARLAAIARARWKRVKALGRTAL